MPRQENLTVIKGGLNRQRTKGAALKDSLYELLNGFVTTEKTVKVRPGTILEETLNAGTVGLVHFDEKFHVFAEDAVTVPGGYELHILQNPDDPTLPLERIHFAEPFLGALYVSAEFIDGSTFHYWLQTGQTWEANTGYDLGEIVEPTTPNGFIYKARRSEGAFPAWTAGTPRALDDVVEPTVENGYKYTVTQLIGPVARSGDIEPEWPEQAGAIIVEDLDDFGTPTPDDPPTPRRIPDDIDDERDRRYRGRGGGGPRRHRR